MRNPQACARRDSEKTGARHVPATRGQQSPPCTVRLRGTDGTCGHPEMDLDSGRLHALHRDGIRAGTCTRTAPGWQDFTKILVLGNREERSCFLGVGAACLWGQQWPLAQDTEPSPGSTVDKAGFVEWTPME